jgi:hypothetical protein
MKPFLRIIPILLCVYLLSTQILSAQQDLLNTLDNASAHLKEVKTSNSTWKQTLRTNKQQPYVVVYEVITTDKKGKSATQEYEFNLADIDASSIKYDVKKDEMQIKMKSLRNNKFIKETRDQKIKYLGDVTLYAENIENARALTEAFQKAVPLAKKALEETIKVGKTYGDLADWLSTNVKNISSGGESYKQSVSFADGFKRLKVKLTQQPENKGKGEEEIFEFNLADINEKNIGLDVSDSWAYLELPTKSNQKYIRHSKNDKVQNNKNSVRLYFDSVEKAREGALVLEKLLPMAKAVRDELKPAYGSVSNGLKLIQAAVKNTGEVEQSIKPECQTVLSVSESGKPMEYRFSWGDVKETAPEIKASGKGFEMQVETSGKFIEVWKSGEKQNYTSSINIVADDIETLRFLPDIMKQVIADCKASSEAAMSKNKKDLAHVNSLLGNSPSVKNISQAFEKKEDCRLTFDVTEEGSKKSEKMKYELSLAELDPSSVDLDISGSNVFVTIGSQNKEKIIKSFKDGAPSDYVNSIEIAVDTIPMGKEIKEYLTSAITACKK